MLINNENAPDRPFPPRTHTALDITAQACLQQEKVGQGVCGVRGQGQLFRGGVALCYPSMTKVVWNRKGVIAFQIKEGISLWDIDQDKLVFLMCDLISRAVDVDTVDLFGPVLKYTAR